MKMKHIMNGLLKPISSLNLAILVPIYISCLFHTLTMSDAADSPNPVYKPLDNIAVDCGFVSSNNGSTSDLSERTWLADTNFLSDQSNNSSVALQADEQSSRVERVPYLTARISRSNFTYTFPLNSPGPKFIRLHFYPTSSYKGFDRNNAYFAVHVGDYTLLSNFSTALTADNISSEAFSKEFYVYVERDKQLSLKFTPSPDMPDSYAFVNGIEIVSMPDDLYYTADDDTEGMFLVGQIGTPFRIQKNWPLENVYRVRVGGQPISPKDDTGMYRFWEADDDYLKDARPSALPVNTSIQIRFKNTSNCSAPEDLYKTARTMGVDASVNQNYKITWGFPVDSSFTYFIRLHFCEFQSEIVASGDRVFQIYIDDRMAESEADVIGWSGGAGIPIYKNFAVTMGNLGTEKQRMLYVALHPISSRYTKYSDSILNGLEIFKLGIGGSLAGPNPDPKASDSPPNVLIRTTKKKKNQKTIISIVGGVVAGFAVLSLLGFLIFRRRLRVKDSGFNDGAPWWSQFSSTTVKSSKSSKSRGSLPSDLSRYFTLAEIKAATNNFDKVFIIGVGGFGNVYKGFIDGGGSPVAIKRLNPESQQGALEFQTEIEMLSQLRHLHLVSLIGYCNDDHEMILVYDFMARGTLRDHLYHSENPPLPWKQRLEICIGAARGLHYLHTGAKHTIIHRDVKTTNILLDEKWVAKVSDFGLSKVGPTNMSKAHVSTVVKGSFGYLDPEYYRRQQLTEKSDVYSFGVVLCEVLCARPPINRTVNRREVSLAVWAQQNHRKGTLEQIIDPFLKGKIAPECLKQFGEVAMSCLLDEGIERPSMNDVVWGLEFALQLQESAEEKMKLSGGRVEIEVDDEEMPFRKEEALVVSVDDSGELFSSVGEHVRNPRSTNSFSITTSEEQSFGSKDSDRLLSGAIFSQIRNPQGR